MSVSVSVYVWLCLCLCASYLRRVAVLPDGLVLLRRKPELNVLGAEGERARERQEGEKGESTHVGRGNARMQTSITRQWSV